MSEHFPLYNTRTWKKKLECKFTIKNASKPKEKKEQQQQQQQQQMKEKKMQPWSREYVVSVRINICLKNHSNLADHGRQ